MNTGNSVNKRGKNEGISQRQFDHEGDNKMNVYKVTSNSVRWPAIHAGSAFEKIIPILNFNLKLKNSFTFYF